MAEVDRRHGVWERIEALEFDYVYGGEEYPFSKLIEAIQAIGAAQ